MRRLAVVLAVAAAGGCGGETRTLTVTTTVTATAAEVTPPPRLPFPLPEDGVLPVEEFNAYMEKVDAPWERDLASVVGAFVEAGASDAASRSFESTVRGEGASATATMTFDGLFDDSVRTQRYDFELARRADGTWEVASASWAQRCRQGRGHQDFRPARCV